MRLYVHNHADGIVDHYNCGACFDDDEAAGSAVRDDDDRGARDNGYIFAHIVATGTTSEQHIAIAIGAGFYRPFDVFDHLDT